MILGRRTALLFLCCLCAGAPCAIGAADFSVVGCRWKCFVGGACQCLSHILREQMNRIIAAAGVTREIRNLLRVAIRIWIPNGKYADRVRGEPHDTSSRCIVRGTGFCGYGFADAQCLGCRTVLDGACHRFGYQSGGICIEYLGGAAGGLVHVLAA